MLEIAMGGLGLVGAGVIVAVYMLLEAEKISSRSPRYYALNALGAGMIMVSIAADLDPGDLGGVMVEVMWLGVSLWGLMKALRRQKTVQQSL